MRTKWVIAPPGIMFSDHVIRAGLALHQLRNIEGPIKGSKPYALLLALRRREKAGPRSAWSPLYGALKHSETAKERSLIAEAVDEAEDVLLSIATLHHNTSSAAEASERQIKTAFRRLLVSFSKTSPASISKGPQATISSSRDDPQSQHTQSPRI